MAEVKKAAQKYTLGTGRRKTAVARVRLSDGSGTISINQRPLENYFTEDKDRNAVLGPLLLTEMLRSDLKRFMRKRTATTPMIVPVVLEI